MSSLARFLTAFEQAAEKGIFIKCTLSKPTAQALPDLRNVYCRPVLLKKGLHIAFNHRFKTKDEVKNFTLPEARIQLERWLGGAFLHADLYTAEADWSLSIDKNGQAHIQSRPPAQATPADVQHDRAKNRLLDAGAPWLHHLGITNAKGVVLADAYDKWRQINKYLEIISALLQDRPLPADANIADMGSGKGYLTFALYDFLRHKGLQPHILGIELRQALVDKCNAVAQQVGFDSLQFVAQDIAQYHPERLDMLVALHACDTATDLALYTGLRNKAAIIVAAPCCHKQIRRDMDTQNEMAPLLRHGILEERQAEILTDGIRALLLEANGYKTNVFEFIATEHTAKNVMITALRSPAYTPAGATERLHKIARLKEGFGIREHYLEHLLKTSGVRPEQTG